MDQKINIKIAGGTFKLTASSPEQEEHYRLAAEAINKRYAHYTAIYPGKTVADLLSMVALNETVFRMEMQKELEGIKKGQQELERDLERYLKDAE